jgi:hypothetical protein
MLVTLSYTNVKPDLSLRGWKQSWKVFEINGKDACVCDRLQLLCACTHITHVEGDLQVTREGLVELRVEVQNIQQIVSVDLV